MSMFCYQCEQSAAPGGCTVQGVYGKTAPVANLQDELTDQPYDASFAG